MSFTCGTKISWRWRQPLEKLQPIGISVEVAEPESLKIDA
jgi:hypothetical protein